jgi:hypothetical protein
MPGADRRRLIGCAILLPAIGAALRLLGLSRTYRVLGRSSHPASASPVEAESAQAYARNLARLIGIASRHGPYHATCLRQSLALWWLLRRKGLAADLRVGVGRRDAAVDAHAWVELEGRVLNDRATIGEDYAPYERLDRVLSRSRQTRAT